MDIKELIKYCKKLHTISFDIKPKYDFSKIKTSIDVGLVLDIIYKNVKFVKRKMEVNDTTTKEEILNFYKNILDECDRELFDLYNNFECNKICLIKPVQFVEYDKSTNQIIFKYIIGTL